MVPFFVRMSEVARDLGVSIFEWASMNKTGISYPSSPLEVIVGMQSSSFSSKSRAA